MSGLAPHLIPVFANNLIQPPTSEALPAADAPRNRNPMTNILLTGSSRGIGAAIAQVLSAGDGIRLIGHGTASGIPADFSDPAGPRQLWDKALAELGTIDVVVNNAGVFEDNPIDLGDDEWVAGWERTMRINLTASAELCRFAVKHWQERRSGGRIVNVASRAAYRGDSPNHWHYAASKAGMVAMTKSIARGYAGQNILAFAVCPGFTMTGMAEEYLSSRGGEKLLADIPLGRVADPSEVAETVRWLALDAPASVTGSVIDVNGASYVR